MKRCFSEAFYNSKIYSTDACPFNVYNLYNACVEPSLSEFETAPDINILFVVTVQSTENLEKNLFVRRVDPLFARNSQKYFEFHAVLEVDGWVFDLDYSSVPKVLEKAFYFRSMFDLKNDHLIYAIRPIPAENYVSKLRENKINWKLFFEDSQQDYPLVSVEEYLSN